MSLYAILFILSLAGGITALLYILARPHRNGNVAVAASLAVAFLVFTIITVIDGGLMPFWDNHTNNLAGVQVWTDLLLALGLAFFLLASRARKVSMNLGLWALAVVLTASIGLLAMAARLFWLERQQGEAA